MQKVMAIAVLLLLLLQRASAQLIASALQPVSANEHCCRTPFSAAKRQAPKPNGLMIAGGCSMIVGAATYIYGVAVQAAVYDSQSNNLTDEQHRSGQAFETGGAILVGAGLAAIVAGAIINKKGQPQKISVMVRSRELGLALRL